MPKGETLVAKGYFNPDGGRYTFGKGKRLLQCHLWYRRNKAERKYQFIDDVYVKTLKPAQLKKNHDRDKWKEFPLTYFDPDTLVHVDLHLIPVASKTVRKGGSWAYLKKEDEEAIEANVWDCEGE